MSTYIPVVKRPYIPVVKRPATTVSGVLRQAHALLEEEGRWIAGNWIIGDNPIDPEDPLCGDWQVCADGALLAVVLGIPAYSDEDPDGPVCMVGGYDLDLPDATPEQVTRIQGARAALADVIREQQRLSPAGYFWPSQNMDTVYTFNDHAKRSDVLEVFRKAYRHQQYVERVARKAAA